MVKLETRVLGRAHALEHRQARREARRLGRPPRPAAPAAPPGDGARRALGGGPVVGEEAHRRDRHPRRHAADRQGPVLQLRRQTRRASRRSGIRRPVTGGTRQPATGDNMWCGGQTLLADGRVLVAGGTSRRSGEHLNGLDTIYTFDPWTENWTFQGRMRAGRWYPTTTTLPDGRVYHGGPG